MRIKELGKMVKSKTNLVEASFCVCCNHKENNNKACIETMNEIRSQFNNIVTLVPTKPYGDTEDMCVFGTARINPKMKDKFRRDLKNLKFPSKDNRRINKARVLLPQ